MYDIIKIHSTSCDYCIPCPKEVCISEVFALYNEKFLFPEKKCCHDLHSSDMTYALDLISENQDASLCINCGKHVKKCPQHLEIPKLLKQVNEDFMMSITDALTPLLKKIISNKDIMEKLENQDI